jgi:hypothetical protein
MLSVIFRLSLELLWWTTAEYCLLKLFAILTGQEIYLPLNLIGWFPVSVDFPFNLLITLKSF